MEEGYLWKRIDRLTEKNTARWIDGWMDRQTDRQTDRLIDKIFKKKFGGSTVVEVDNA